MRQLLAPKKEARLQVALFRMLVTRHCIKVRDAACTAVKVCSVTHPHIAVAHKYSVWTQLCFAMPSARQNLSKCCLGCFSLWWHACLVALMQFGVERVKAVAQGEGGARAAEGLLSGKGVL